MKKSSINFNLFFYLLSYSRCNYIKHFLQFFIIDFNETSKEQKKQSFFNLFTKFLLLDETTKRRFLVNDDRNLNLKLFINSDLHDLNINVIILFVIIIIVVIFFFFSFFLLFFVFFFFFFLFLLRFNEIQIESNLRRNKILSVCAKLSFS